MTDETRPAVAEVRAILHDVFDTQYAALRAELTASRARVRELERYAQHLREPKCAWWGGEPCTCGLAALLVREEGL